MTLLSRTHILEEPSKEELSGACGRKDPPPKRQFVSGLSLGGGFYLFLFGRVVLLVAVSAAVNLAFFISQIENMVQTLLYGTDAARILAVDDIDKLLGKLQFLLFDDLTILDDIDRDRMIYEAESIQVQLLQRGLYFYDVLLTHLVRVGMHDHCDLAVHTVELETLVDVHSLACRDMVQNDSFIKLSNIQHYTFTPRSVRISAILT